jgi:fatty-acyl-CoA synthase
VPGDDADVAVIDPESMQECPRARFDENGALLNADEAIGELVGRNVLHRFEGYYRNDEATDERTRGGWYWSGDLAYRDSRISRLAPTDEGLVMFPGTTITSRP